MAIVGALDRGGVEIEDQRLRRIEVGWQGQPDFVPALFTADGDDAEGPIVGLDTYLHRRYVRGAWVGEDEDQCCRAPRCGRGEADLPILRYPTEGAPALTLLRAVETAREAEVGPVEDHAGGGRGGGVIPGSGKELGCDGDEVGGAPRIVELAPIAQK